MTTHKEHEPVAVYVGETWCGSVVRLYEDLSLETPLYTHPPTQRPSRSDMTCVNATTCGEPVAIYQLQKSDGSWIDQDKGSYRYNSQHGHTVRIVYTTTPPVTESHNRKPLTLGQKQRLWSSLGNKPTLKDRVNAYGSAIEAAHGIVGGTHE